MIVGFAGTHLGLLQPQTPALEKFFALLKMTAFIHRGRGNSDTLVHNMIRRARPSLPIHVLPLLDEHSVIASIKNDDPATTIWARDDRNAVNRIIANLVSGIVFVPKSAHEETEDGWDLVHVAREIGVPVLIVWPNGQLDLERSEI
jgi:hypothetical protein